MKDDRMSWWADAQALTRPDWYTRLRQEQERIQALGINPTAAHMATARTPRRQREDPCE
jgi:hypothetical protein